MKRISAIHYHFSNLSYSTQKKRALRSRSDRHLQARHHSKTERARLKQRVQRAHVTLGADVSELTVVKGCKFYQYRVRLSGRTYFLLLSLENHLLEMDFNRHGITLTFVFKNASHSLTLASLLPYIIMLLTSSPTNSICSRNRKNSGGI